MSGQVDWPTLVFVVVSAGTVSAMFGGFMWWLADQFKTNRHDMANALNAAVSPLRDEIDDLRAEVVRIKTILNGKY